MSAYFYRPIRFYPHHDGRAIAEPCEKEEAQVWGIYRDNQGGFISWVQDVLTEEHAKIICRLLGSKP